MLNATISNSQYATPEILYDEPRNRSADVSSLGCVFTEIFTVLANQSLSELEDSLRTKAGVSYGGNIDGRFEWVKKISTELNAGQIRFLLAVEGMFSEEMDERPTARQVWEIASATPRHINGDRTGFCGQCCNLVAPNYNGLPRH